MYTKELTLEEITEIITSKPIQQGGVAKFMWNECFIPYIELTQKHLANEGIKIIFVKE